jgi:hypothetical protein
MKKLIGTIDLTPKPPTTKDIQTMASAIIEVLGGASGAADKLSYQNFYTLAYLASLRTDKAKT